MARNSLFRSTKTIYGTEGDDTLSTSSKGGKAYGLGGDDLLQGSFGADTLDGGDGNDDIVDNVFGNDDDTTRDVLIGGAGDDTIRSEGGADVIDGGEGNDHITASGDGATIDGGAGNDAISTYGGNVQVDGGEGVDRAAVSLVDASNDLSIDFTSGATTSFQNGTTFSNIEAFSISGGSGNDFFDMTDFDDSANGNTGNDTLIGRGGNDALIGAEGADVIDGGDGNDVITSSEGLDVLTGGAGADYFVYDHSASLGAGANADRIVDFNAAEGDKLDLRTLLLEESYGPFTGDPVADGDIRLTDTAEGVLVELDPHQLGYIEMALLENVTIAELGSDIFLV
jgi:Ca2+-binding RTX toxin-like protein